MTDPYENIRKALAMGPTPGPWKVWDDVIYYDNGNFQVLRHFITSHEADVVGAYGIKADDRPSANADAAHIAACDPDTIRELLAERDALAQENEAMRRCAIKYLTWLDAVCRPPEDVLREDMANPDMCGDAAIAAANGGGNG